MKRFLLFTLAALTLGTGLAQAQPSSNWNQSDWYRYDTNGDGKLDGNEWSTMQRGWNNNNRDSWSRWDTNNDGRIDRHERNAASQQWSNWNNNHWKETSNNWDRNSWNR